MGILKSSTRRLVKSIEIFKVPSSSTFIYLQECYSLLNIVRMKRMISTGSSLDKVDNAHIDLVFSQTQVIMEMNQQMKVKL